MKNKAIIGFLLAACLLASCQSREKKELVENKDVLLAEYDDEEKSILEKITGHQDLGYYTYITRKADDGTPVQKISYGYDPNQDISIQIEGGNLYSLTKGDLYTAFNTDKGLYYQDKKEGQRNKDDPEVKKLMNYNELTHKGKFKIEKNPTAIKLIFDDGSYDIYDPETYDLLESKFSAEGNFLIKKLDKKEDDLDKIYQDLYPKIKGMKRVDSINEVTGKQ